MEEEKDSIHHSNNEVNEPLITYNIKGDRLQTLFEIKKKLKALKSNLAKDFSVERIGIFGSFARNEQNENSDIDILVEFNRPVVYEFFRLQRFLENQLGRKIDLATKAMLKPRIKDSILNETTFV